MMELLNLNVTLNRFLLLCGLFLLTSCSPVSPTDEPISSSPTVQIISSTSQTMTPLPTTTPTATLTPSLVHTVTPEQTLSAISTNTPSIWESLPPGQYVVYSSWDMKNRIGGEGVDFKIVSLNGSIVRTIARLHTFDTQLSPDRKRIAYIGDLSIQGDLSYPYVLYLETLTNISIPKIESCQDLSWSPDSTRLAVGCREIYVISVLDGTKVQWTPRATELLHYLTIAWSPDGRWIAYHQLYDNTWDRDLGGGLYLTDTTCLSDVSTCPEKTRFGHKFEKFFSLTWSPDSRRLAAFFAPGKIMVWDIETNAFREVTVPGWDQTAVGFNWGFLAWSPDGEWFAYSQPDADDPYHEIDDEILVIPVDGGEPRLILDTPEIEVVMGWIIIPWPFQVGDTYTITENGADLNLRAEPSLDGNVLTKLQPGDVATILDGPVEADGYTWWKMQTEDGTEGWAVNIPEWYEAAGE